MGTNYVKVLLVRQHWVVFVHLLESACLNVAQVSYEELGVPHSGKGFRVVNMEVAKRFNGPLEVKFALAMNPGYFPFAIGVWHLKIHFTSYGAIFTGSDLEEGGALGNSYRNIKVATV